MPGAPWKGQGCRSNFYAPSRFLKIKTTHNSFLLVFFHPGSWVSFVEGVDLGLGRLFLWSFQSGDCTGLLLILLGGPSWSAYIYIYMSHVK